MKMTILMKASLEEMYRVGSESCRERERALLGKPT